LIVVMVLRSIPAASPRLLDAGLLYCAVTWGATFFIVKEALSGIHPVAMVAYRFLAAALILAPGLIWVKPARGWHFLEGAGLSVLLAALYLSQTLGLRYTSAANSGFITGLFIFFVPVLSLLLGLQRVSRFQWGCVCLAGAGLWLVTGGLEGLNQGDALTLVSALAYAGHLLAMDFSMKRGANALVLSFQQFWMTGVFSLVVMFLAGIPPGPVSPAAWKAVIFLAALPTCSAFLVQSVCQRRVPPLKVSLIFSLEPAFAALFAWTLGGEIFRPWALAGGSLILAAMLAHEWGRFRFRGTPEPSPGTP
jgi:drug/metabolite transporter (DMT)-like permease